MLEPMTCRSCGRQVRTNPSMDELRERKQPLCRGCSREPATLELGIRRVIRRMGNKLEQFEAL